MRKSAYDSLQLGKQSFYNLMTETATEIYCRLNNVQEIQSEMDATNKNRCFRMETDSAGGVCVCVLSGFLFIEDNVSGSCFFARFPPQ